MSNWLRQNCSATLLLGLIVATPLAFGQTKTLTITYRPGESASDTRYDYDTRALYLALEKTTAKYGPYRLVASPAMTFSRAIASVSHNEYENFFIKLSYEDRYLAMDMRYARFPVDLGIVGYRVCFSNPDSQARLAKVSTLDELRKLSHGQGRDWADVQILRHNGFRVIEAGSYESLFQMVANKRFDLFCRGTNEILSEFKAHKQLQGLQVDDSITIAYPLPRFFYTHAANRQAAERIEEGLVLAYRDGSLQEAWRQNYQASIDFVQLGRRKVFRLDNPLLKQIDFDYQQYFYDPFATKKGKKNR